jgi:predicted ATP-dependent endonuclease of OLD family
MSAKNKDDLAKYRNASKSVYMNKVLSAYKIEQDIAFTGEHLYDEIQKKLLGSETERKAVRDFEHFIGDNFYDGIEFSLIPRLHEKILYVKIGKAKDTALYDLGDGVKQLIVLLYKVFENKENEMYFFIEEPELNLHPAFQRKFIELIRKFEKHQYFITSHSNHFLDLAMEYSDISIFKFKNKSEENNAFSIENVKPDDITILQELGVNNSSVFLANCSVWVEGISDRIYIKKYLELYQQKLEEKNEDTKPLKEGLHYTFIEYGGANLSHFSFEDESSVDNIKALKVSNKIFLLCDNDDNIGEGKKAERKTQLKVILGDDFYELKCREIENLISKETLVEFIKDDNSLDELQYKQTGQTITEDDYQKQDVYLGKFIEDTFANIKKYASESGTIKSKADFAKKITAKMTSFDDLSPQARDLTETIYKFIKRHN